MTEREKRNEEIKVRIRRDTEAACQYIDLMESELRHREAMCQSFAEQIDTPKDAPRSVSESVHSDKVGRSRRGGKKVTEYPGITVRYARESDSCGLQSIHSSSHGDHYLIQQESQLVAWTLRCASDDALCACG